MFGHVQANLADLPQEETNRYKAAYCGLCHVLGKRHGVASRFALTYDLTFLALLLSSLYEPEEQSGESRCMAHPAKKHWYVTSSCTEYAADMTIALTYYKCLDDWQDDRKLSRRTYAALLSSQYKKVKEKWPAQCSAIETNLKELSRIENEGIQHPDLATNCFGHLMSALFLYKEDFWAPYLKQLGFFLGKYIYLADAAIDFNEDRKSGSYNPLTELTSTPEQLRDILKMLLGEASEAFESLPLVQDLHLLRNILYSGIWLKYNLAMKQQEERNMQT